VTESPRQQLLERAVAHLTENGIGDVSLRELAAAIGTSHRMLSYHFGSKQGLLVAVVQETERRQREALAGLAGFGDGDLIELTRAFWARLRSAEVAPLERLFFELYGQALQGRPHAAPLLQQIVSSWVDPTVPLLMSLGLTEAEARVEARLGIAVVRGLLLDVLATGEGEEVDAAFEQYLAYREQRLAALGVPSGTVPP
jgi:AcrR family transcriptional regulator